MLHQPSLNRALFARCRAGWDARNELKLAERNKILQLWIISPITHRALRAFNSTPHYTQPCDQQTARVLGWAGEAFGPSG
jgi:hypothetical protein